MSNKTEATVAQANNDDTLGKQMRVAFMDRIGEIAGPWMDADHHIRAGWRAAARVALDQHNTRPTAIGADDGLNAHSVAKIYDEEGRCPHCNALEAVESQKSSDKVHPYRVICTACGCGTAWHGDYASSWKSWTQRAKITDAGEAMLEQFRATLDMQCPVEFGTMPDCKCPHEHWHIGPAGACVDIHVEDEGYTHVMLDMGDLGHEVHLHGVSTLEAAKPIAFLWASTVLGIAPPSQEGK